MHRKLNLPDLFLAISLATIALEAALGSARAHQGAGIRRRTRRLVGHAAGQYRHESGDGRCGVRRTDRRLRGALFDISPASPWAWIAIFFLDDFTYYWFHRVSHECRFWWAAHVNHHSSQEYNLSTAVRQSWTSVIVGTWTPWIPLALLGFPPAMILAQQGFNLFYQFWIHTEVVRRMPAWFEYLFNTPSHHRVHHASNPRYLDRNYAGVLMVWDRLFGTFVEERDEEPARYGIMKNIETYNPIRIAFHEWSRCCATLGGALLARSAGRRICGRPAGVPMGGPDSEEYPQRVEIAQSRALTVAHRPPQAPARHRLIVITIMSRRQGGVRTANRRTISKSRIAGTHEPTAVTAVQCRNRHAKSTHGRRCLEYARSGPRRARLHDGQPLAKSSRVSPGPGGHPRFLGRKWSRELDYRLIKELWAFAGNRIAVRFAYEWHDEAGQWFRSYGNENWEFDDQGLMRLRIASINDLPIREPERKYRWPLGRRPDEHPSLSALGL